MKVEANKLVTFRLGDDLFAADIFSVERVLRYTAPTSVPDMPAYIEGVIDYQGRVVPIVNLRRRFEMPDGRGPQRDAHPRPARRWRMDRGRRGLRHRGHGVRSGRGRAAAQAVPRTHGRVPQGDRPHVGEARDLPRRREAVVLHASASHSTRPRPRRRPWRMGDWANAYRERVHALAVRFDADDAPQHRDVLRGELIALGKGLEQDLAELHVAQGRSEVARREVEGAASSRRRPHSARERPVVADHIGASTFIEKGWSRISLGDYRRRGGVAEQGAAARPQRSAGRVAARLGADAPGEVRRRADAIPEGAHARAGQRARAHQRRIHLPEEGDLRRGDRAPVQGDPPGQRSQGDALRALLSRPGVSRA